MEDIYHNIINSDALSFLKIHNISETEDLHLEFEKIASELMNDWILQINNSKYRIIEIEFYFKGGRHDDNYTHEHELQKKFGRWYFHGSGLDITFGNNNFYGGILIREIYNLDTKVKPTYGPINVVTELFSNIQTVYINKFSFGLIPDKDKIITRQTPIAAPRVGLNRTKNPSMYDKLYRFLVLPSKQHAEKAKIAESMERQGYSKEEIKDKLG